MQFETLFPNKLSQMLQLEIDQYKADWVTEEQNFKEPHFLHY